MASKSRRRDVVAKEADRTLPHHLDAERSVLGAILVNNAAFEVAVEIVQASDFYRDAHRRIFVAIAKLLEQDKSAVDSLTLATELDRTGDLDDAGGRSYLVELMDGMPASTNVRHYAGIVRERAKLRDVIMVSNRAMAAAYDGTDTAEEILDGAERDFLNLRQRGSAGGMQPLRQSLRALMEDCEYRTTHRGELRGAETGFPSINAHTMGFQRGTMTVLAARTSIGKTALLLNFLTAAAASGTRAGVFSMEMDRQSLEHRLLSSLTGIPLERILAGTLAGREYESFSTAIQTMHDLPLEIDDRAGLTVPDMRRAIRQMNTTGDRPVGVIGIDYLQLIPGTIERRGATRNEELTDISRRIKLLAVELGIAIVALSQLKRGRGRPGVDDLRDSGAIEQDSDVVLLLHRPNHRSGGTTECCIAKNRNGPTGTVNLTIDLETVTFSDGGEPLKPDTKSDAKSETRADLWSADTD